MSHVPNGATVYTRCGAKEGYGAAGYNDKRYMRKNIIGAVNLFFLPWPLIGVFGPIAGVFAWGALVPLGALLAAWSIKVARWNVQEGPRWWR